MDLTEEVSSKFLKNINGYNIKCKISAIGSNFYDLTPSPEFMHIMDVASNPSKMYHLLMNDLNYAALFNEQDPMEELHEPVELPKRPKSPPVAEIEEDLREFDITPLPIEDFEVPFPPNEDIKSSSSEKLQSPMKNIKSSE